MSNPQPPSPNSSAAQQQSRAKALRDARNAKEEKMVKQMLENAGVVEKDRKQTVIERLNERKRARFVGEWVWVVSFFCWVL